MSERLTQAEKLKLLRGADEGTLPKRICQDNADFSYDILAELCDDGLMKAEKHDAIANRCFHDIKITSLGRKQLEELQQAVPDQAGKPSANGVDKQKDWVDKAIGRIGIGVTIFVLGAAAIWAIAHWWSVLLGVIG